MDAFGTDDIFNCNVNELFEKKFTFQKKDDWILPQTLVEDAVWSIDSLTDMKKDLNNTKSLLNDKGQDWHEHTTKINKASLVLGAIKRIIQPEILTQAWCKFFEIVSSFNLIRKCPLFIRSLHLCEAPGGFVSALNYFLCVNHPSLYWEWMANTLNPYYEGHSINSVIVDDRLLFPTLRHWHFGEDNTGDITNANYINEICTKARISGLYDLVTADGSINCLDNPGEQELIVEKLHFSEVLIALNSLLPEGCFVLKKFTLFECSTICQMYLLNCVFKEVHVFKPFTSRSSNSEVYIICIGFQGSESLTNILIQFREIYGKRNIIPIFSQSSVPESFIQQIVECMTLFTRLQIQAIQENLKLYPLTDDLIQEKVDNLKHKCAKAYIQKYSVCSSPVYDALKLYKKTKVLTSFSNESQKDLKSLYFEGVGDTFNNLMKSPTMKWIDKLLDVEKRINNCFANSRKRALKNFEWNQPWKELRLRIKSKDYSSWINMGKKVTSVTNSKFCFPILLHLWNRISLDPEVDLSYHMQFEYCSYTDALEYLFEEDSLMERNVGVISVSSKYIQNDPLLSQLKENFGFTVEICLDVDVTTVRMARSINFIYINSTTWENSLHNECLVKANLTKALICALEKLKEGDTLLLCIQSLLTRYTVGLIFIFISLFEKFTTVLPEQSAPACKGQLWIFKNFENNEWSGNIYQYLHGIDKRKVPNEKEILEIAPFTAVCDKSFQTYLRDLNNKHILQRLNSLISVEKSKIAASL